MHASSIVHNTPRRDLRNALSFTILDIGIGIVKHIYIHIHIHVHLHIHIYMHINIYTVHLRTALNWDKVNLLSFV